MPTTAQQSPAPSGADLHARPPDYRRERRYAIPKGMNLKVRTAGRDEFVDVELRDISRNGVGLISPKAVLPGASISFLFGSQRIFAQARYCHSTPAGFVVGALILEVVAENGAISPTLNV